MEKNKIGKNFNFLIEPAILMLCLIMLTGCGTVHLDGRLQAEALTSSELEQIDNQLNDLYQSFCYAAGEEPNWELMRSVFVEGAQFVGEAPAGEAPRPQAIDEFISSWQTSMRGE